MNVILVFCYRLSRDSFLFYYILVFMCRLVSDDLLEVSCYVVLFLSLWFSVIDRLFYHVLGKLIWVSFMGLLI